MTCTLHHPQLEFVARTELLHNDTGWYSDAGSEPLTSPLWLFQLGEIHDLVIKYRILESSQFKYFRKQTHCKGKVMQVSHRIKRFIFSLRIHEIAKVWFLKHSMLQKVVKAMGWFFTSFHPLCFLPVINYGSLHNLSDDVIPGKHKNRVLLYTTSTSKYFLYICSHFIYHYKSL